MSKCTHLFPLILSLIIDLGLSEKCKNNANLLIQAEGNSLIPFNFVLNSTSNCTVNEIT